MADRRAQILALLATRYDHLPEPVRRDHTAPGFVHRTLAPQVCPTCDGLDETRACPTCRGRGEIEVWRGRDPYSVDHIPVAGTDRVKLGHLPHRDAEIARLAQQTQPAVATELDLVAAANQHPYGWERARRRMYAQFDYAALDLALERLAGMSIAPHTDRGLALLSLWLPDPLRAPEIPVAVNAAARGPKVDPRARQRRDDQVRELLAQGRSYADVAQLVGLTVRQLRRIVNAAVEEAA